MGWSFRYRTSGMPLGVPSGAVRKVSVTALGGEAAGIVVKLLLVLFQSDCGENRLRSGFS